MEDPLFWLASGRKKARRITRLIGGIQRDPFTGAGKAEPLKGDLPGQTLARYVRAGPNRVTSDHGTGKGYGRPLKREKLEKLRRMLARLETLTR